MLLLVGDSIEEVRPQQIISFKHPIKNKFLKQIQVFSKKAKTKPIFKKKKIEEPSIVIKEIKLENTDGSS